MRKSVRRTVTTAAIVLGLTACMDLGLPGNIPLAEAENRQFRYAVYEMSEPGGHRAGVLSFADRGWMPAGEPERIPERLLVPVGMVSGSPVHALAFDTPPYRRLFLRGTTGRWQPLAEVP